MLDVMGFNGPLFQGTTCGVPPGGFVGAWVTAQNPSARPR